MNAHVDLIRQAFAWAETSGFPKNTIVRDLRTSPSFQHGGLTLQNTSRSSDLLCNLMAGLIVTQQYRTVLEVGTLFGYSTIHLAEALQATNGKLDTVDHRRSKITWSTGESVEDIHKSAERFVAEAGFSSIVTFHAGDSTALLPRFVLTGRQYDMVFLDGSHSRYAVTLDLINAINLLRPGGAIVLDDVSAEHGKKKRNRGGPNSILPAFLATGQFSLIPTSHNTLVAFQRI